MKSYGPSEDLEAVGNMPRLGGMAGCFCVAAAVLLVGFLAVPAFAQSGPTQEGYQRRPERWRALPPRERRLILNRWREYQKSPADKKIEINNRLKKWQSMETEKRTRLREKYRRFRKLPAEERNRLIKRYRGHTRPPVVKRRFRPHRH